MTLFTSQLLDIISPGSYRRPRVRLDEAQSRIEQIKPKKVVDTLANHHGCCDNMADSCCHGSDSCCSHAADSVSASANGLMDYIGNGGGGTSTLIWSIVAVLLALVLCFYFVSVYRKRLSPR